MVLRRIEEVPRELPHAHIFLDDIEEISRILQEAVAGAEVGLGRFTGPDSSGQQAPPSTRYEFGGTMTDTLEDLRSLGGSTTEFELQVGESFGCGLRFYHMLNPTLELHILKSDEAWAVYGRVRSIFDHRRLRLKNAILDMPAFLKVILASVLFVLLPPAFVAFARKSPSGVWFLLAYIAFDLALIVYIFFWPSRVMFVASHDKERLSAASRRHNARDLVMIAVGGVITALAEFLVRHLFK